VAKIKPFLRWAGGKRWLTTVFSHLLASRLRVGGTYFEPFLGSGAMFFALSPKRAILSDTNKELIVTFQEVARNPKAIMKRLAEMPVLRDEYYRVRKWRPRSDIYRAVRFIYLNRNCYGGLYRENKEGSFNVPYGGGKRNHLGICTDETLPRASSALNLPKVELRVCDFGDALKSAGEGDVVYCDPTYREVTRKQFDRYGKIIFRWEDQERLAVLAKKAWEKGAIVILSNTTCNGIRDLYQEAAIIEVERRKGLGMQKDQLKQVEYLFILDPCNNRHWWEQISSSKTSSRNLNK
jgi:DNA adenine methylase